MIALISSLLLFRYSIDSYHDIYFHLARILGLARGLEAHQFPVRIDGEFGTLATPIFYPNLFLYIPSITYLAGLSMIDSMNLFLLIINFATVFTMFYATEKITKNDYIAAISAIVYSCASYRITGIYIRGICGELQAMVFLPILLLGFYEIVFRDGSKYWYIVIGATGIIQSHILFTLMSVFIFGILCIIYINRFLKEKNRIISLVKSVIFIILINLWFLIPFAQFVLTVPVNIGSRSGGIPSLLSINQFLKFLYEVPDTLREFDFGGKDIFIGILIVIVFVISIISLFITIKKNKTDLKFINLLIIGILLFPMCLSSFPYKIIQNIPLLNYISSIQYGFRFIPFALLFLSIPIGYYIYKLFSHNLIPIVTVFIIAIITVLEFEMQIFNIWSSYNAKSIVQVNIYYNDALDYSNHIYGKYFLQSYNDYFPRGSNNELFTIDNYLTNSKKFLCQSYKQIASNINMKYIDYSYSDDTYVSVCASYYPGYKIVDNKGNVLDSFSGEQHRLSFHPMEANGSIRIRYVGFWWWRLSEIISLLTIIFALHSRIRKKA